MKLMEPVKFCNQCSNHRHKGKTHLCAANKNTTLDLVTGEYHEGGLVDCNKMRKEDCGEEATLFNKKVLTANK